MRNLVIVMAGDDSLHESYAADRDFELWVCYWGGNATVAERFRQGCDRFFARKGQKWELVREVGRIAREQGLPAFTDYGYVFLPDDDIAFPGGARDISRAFALAREIGADIFQPAIANEHYSWEATRLIPGAVCHATNTFEIMMPASSGQIFENCLLPLLHIHAHLRAGWGIEPLLVRFAEAYLRRPARCYVLDETPAIHTRAIGGNTPLHALGKDEKYLNPVAASVTMTELERFSDRKQAAEHVFPALDETSDRRAMDERMKQVREARLIHHGLLRSRSLKLLPLRALLRLALSRMKA